MDSALNILNPTTITVLLSLTFLYFFLYRPSKPTHHLKAPPSAAGAWPILGHLPLLRNSQTPHRTLGAMADNHGPIFTIKIGTAPTLVLSNWQMAKECFTTNDTAVSSRPTLISMEHMSFNKAMFGSAPYGPYWRRLRKMVTLEILHNRRVEQLRHVRVSEVQTSIKELYDVWSTAAKNVLDPRKGDDLKLRGYDSGFVLVEVKQWFFQVTFNMILRMAVGKRYFGGGEVVEEGEARRCVKALAEYMRLLAVFTVADAVPCLRWFDFGGHEKEMKEIAKEWDGILSGWLEEHQKKRGLGGKDGGDDQDFMDVMISVLGDAKIAGIDAHTIIKATILTLFVGGIDTSSITLSWAIYLLLRNPAVMKKAKEELNSQIGKQRCVNESDISKLEYLQAIVKETLRLYPPAPLSGPREVTDDCTLGDYHVKKGTRLITNLWKIHTDPSVWSDPLEFKPERFLTTHKDVDVKGCHFELLPFGGGRRICPGISFALQIVHFSLASFLHSFEMLNPSSKPVDLTESYGLTNIKTAPLEILVKPCLPPNCYGTK